MKKDEIIRALESCIKSDREWKCPEDCPYIDKRKVLDDEDDCTTLLKIDVIALLKQEPPKEE